MERKTAIRVLLALLLVVPVLEGGFRLVEGREPFDEKLMDAVLDSTGPAPHWSLHSQFGYTLPPGEGNSLGFLAPEPTPRESIDPDARRVLLIGDETLSGFANSLTTLAAGDGVEFDVHDYSLPGYNTVQALAVAREAVPGLRPHWLVVGFNVKDDPLTNTLVTIDEERLLPFPGAIDALREELPARLDLGGVSAIERRWALGPAAPRLRYELSEDPAIMLRALVLLQSIQHVANEQGASLTVALFAPQESSWTGASRVTRTYTHVFSETGFDVVVLDERSQAVSDLWAHARRGR